MSLFMAITWDFYYAQREEVKGRIDQVIGLVRTLRIIPEKFFNHINGSDGLFEIRIKSASDIFRVFRCFDKGNLVVLFNGFRKKSDKIPRQEIGLAEKLKQQYYESKKEE